MFHELDRYNGRHTEIDIISFVRSNDSTNTKQSVGFLAEEIVDLKMVGSVSEIISFTFRDVYLIYYINVITLNYLGIKQYKQYFENL